MQRSVNHKVLGRGRPASCASQVHRARVLKGRRPVADAGRYAALPIVALEFGIHRAQAIALAMSSAPHKYALGPGSELLREGVLAKSDRGRIEGPDKALRYKRESITSAGKPSYLWRCRRLRAVAVYEARFEPVQMFYEPAALPL